MKRRTNSSFTMTIGAEPRSSCAVKSRPAGKVLQGYWENWDGASNGVHPGLGWIPITDARIKQLGPGVSHAAEEITRRRGGRWPHPY